MSTIYRDLTTNADTVIDYAHHEIHAGSHFKAGFQDTNMASGDTINLLFITPNTTKWAHWTLTSQTASGGAKVQVFSAPTTSANGTAVTVFNRNQNSDNVNTTLVYHTPTVSSTGTKISEKWIGSSTRKAEIGGATRGSSEIILKQNTKYLVRLTAETSDMRGAIGGDWYEHTNK